MRSLTTVPNSRRNLNPRNEARVYDRDIARARKSIVSLQVGRDFEGLSGSSGGAVDDELGRKKSRPSEWITG
jgi:hypothetical protein